MSFHNNELYKLSMGEPVTSLVYFNSPIDEYHAAFTDRAHLFFNYYTFQDKGVGKCTLTRGEFWDLACRD